MVTYENTNTGDRVSYEHRSARLDRLDNWQRVSEPEPQSEPRQQKKTSKKGDADAAV
ncbi:hypothetical protein FHX37_4635 [Haloactinospora alba]|uniref:Uncharacterized protein n=1 Tax=Haloactinospora alba TaxID=405555 RepID=A0A543N2P1_9ACTN|nr:hypothetical protein [Haloactinospora alba]TQN26097.1 hypothetical protein FHX37_4635 [Haloactinospora alba]